MKKLLSLLIIVLILTTTSYADFNDINEHWAKLEIEWATEKEIVSGYPDGTFRPDNTITRAEAIKVISILFDVKSDIKQFDDVDNTDWYYEYVNSGHSVMPHLDSKFYPDENITRQDAIYAIIKAKFGEIEFVKPYKYNDSYLITDYATDYISYATEQKIINGYKDNTIRPLSPLTRAEFTKILYVADSIKTEEKPEIEPDTEEKETISNFIPVYSVQTVTNDNGVAVKQIVSDKITLTTTESFDIELKKGDMIIPLINHKNLVQKCTVLSSVNGNGVDFNTTILDKTNNTYKKTKYYYGQINNIENNRFISLTSGIEFTMGKDAEIYIYDTTSRAKNKFYKDYIDIIDFDEGKVYIENQEISKVYIIAREYDGIVNEATIYIF